MEFLTIIPYNKKKIDLEFTRELNYLCGENGSGKTVLLDYIAGLRKEKKSSIKGNENIIYINQNIFFRID